MATIAKEREMGAVAEEQAPRLGLDDAFYCRARRRRLPLSKCLDDYLNANAFNNRRSACWRCPQGRGNREEYANS